MNDESNPPPAQGNRRASARRPLRTNVKIECRKGGLGLGPNLAISAINLAETGVRLILKTALPKGQDVEIIVLGSSQHIKRLAKVVWSHALENGTHDVGFDFERNLSFGEYQDFTQTPRKNC
jgi:hypothetical protein